MIMFGEGMPLPVSTLDDAPFWDAANERRLVIRCCHSCGRHHHPPLPMCPTCQSTDLGWNEAAGAGRLYSFTTVHHAGHPATLHALPYTVALVELDDCDGVRVIGTLLDGSPTEIGTRMELDWFRSGDRWLPGWISS